MRSVHRSKPFARRAVASAAVAACAACAPAFATDGYFPHGYGIKAMGMGGASAAMAVDTFGGANNPASMVWAGSGLDLGLNFFSPKRNAERSGTAAFPPLDGKVESGNTHFLIPEFGYNQMIGGNMSVGVSVYGNGGMNTTYPQGPFQCPTGPTTSAPANMLCGSGTLGVDLMQLVVAPTLAYKLNAEHAVGASLLLGYQQFKAYGLQSFEGLSSAPGSVTDNGYDRSTGLGLRVGYMGRLSDMVALGASYSTKIKMGRFDKYKGLFAGGGKFDIPANYSLGLAFTPSPSWTLALDYQRIQYSGIPSVGNSSMLPNPLGSANGPGFGWKDIDVIKLGVAWRMSDALTLRAGYNHGGNPIRSQDVTFNILAPGVMTEHYTAGLSWAISKTDDISVAGMIAPRKTVTGPSLLNGLMPFPVGNETIGMRQTEIGIAWSRKF
ncbi:MAG: outer membrane protein transport protein [Caldimonas sp.]